MLVGGAAIVKFMYDFGESIQNAGAGPAGEIIKYAIPIMYAAGLIPAGIMALMTFNDEQKKSLEEKCTE